MSLSLSEAWSIGRLDAHAQAALVASGALQPQELIEAAALRIEDGDGALNAVSTRSFDHAFKAVATVDRSAPMAAVPYLLKASLAYPGFPQTSCSRSKANVMAERAYPLAHRFDDAGMVPVGMSTMPEFGLLVSGEAVLPGPTLNPWNPAISAGGSSTGAAVAVAAGLVPLAHASDAAGSIRVPSSNCGVVGFKPGRGMNVRARAGHLLDDLLCSDALIARSVRDAAWGARWCRPADAPVSAFPDRRLRVGVCTEGLSGPAAPDVVAMIERTAALLADLGHEVRPAMPAYDYPALRGALTTLWAYLGGDVTDVIAATHPGEHLPDLLEPWTLGLAAHRDRIPAQHLADAYVAMSACAAASADFFTGFDILLSPVARTTPPALGTLAPTRPYADLAEAFFDYTGFTPIQNITGEPSISLPVHATPAGIPVGAMLSAAQGGDDLVLRLAAEIEAAAPWADRWPAATAAGRDR